MPGTGLTETRNGKAPSETPAPQPYWGKPAVRNVWGADGNVGIIRSPVRAISPPDNLLVRIWRGPRSETAGATLHVDRDLDPDSGDRAPACDWLALVGQSDMDDPLTVECSDISSQLTVIFGFGIPHVARCSDGEGTGDRGPDLRKPKYP
jgi:hypothetical protein